MSLSALSLLSPTVDGHLQGNYTGRRDGAGGGSGWDTFVPVFVGNLVLSLSKQLQNPGE